MKKWISLLLAFTMAMSMTACGVQGSQTSTSTVLTNPAGQSQQVTPSAPVEEQLPEQGEQAPPAEEAPALLDEDGVYDSKEEVALYLYQYGCLPSNYITKNEARALGWSGGPVEVYAPGMCIGGDYFGNREGLLPKAKGREYTECDIDTLGGDGRGAKRIVFSNDGLIYYTEDHYQSFELLYGEEG